MNRIRVIFLLCSLFSTTAHAQGWKWGRGTTGNDVKSWPVATDQAGNVFVAGVSSGQISFEYYGLPFASGGDLCEVAKYDNYGHFLWARSTPNGSHSFLINITTDKAGNCYLMGWMLDSTMQIGQFTLVNTAYPFAQYFIAKYDPTGNVKWVNSGGGRAGINEAPPVIFTGGGIARMFGLGGITAGGNGELYVATCFNLPAVVAGSFILTNKDATGTTDDIMLVKYDSSGNVSWAKSAGGAGDDIPFGIAVTPAGSIYIAGMFNSDSVAFGPSAIYDTATGPQKWNGFIARYTASGTPLWASGSGGTGMVYASGIACDEHNNVYLTGGMAEDRIFFAGAYIENPYPGRPVQYLIKIDGLNSVAWARTMGSPTGGNVWGYGVAVSPMNHVWVSGAFSDMVMLNDRNLRVPSASADPVFIAGFDTLGNDNFGDVLQSGSAHQAGIACDVKGNVFLCSDYKHPVSPFVIANNVLATVVTNESWQYLAKYTFRSSGAGHGGGPDGYGGSEGSEDGAYTHYIEEDTLMCPEDIMVLTAPRGYSLYTWNDGSSDTVLSITSGGVYTVKALGNSDVAVFETFTVKTDSGICNCLAIIPNAFTPNGDGSNDRFGPIFERGCNLDHYLFSIYNRWGQCVFYTQNPYSKWDGTFNGTAADMDVYMFYLDYSTNTNYPHHKKKGDLTLVR